MGRDFSHMGHMDKFREVIELEEKRIGQIIGEMRATLADEQTDRQNKDQEIAELKRQKLDAVGWSEKREIDEGIERCRKRYAMRHYQDGQILSHPYFGILELEDDELGSLSYCLGRQSFFDRSRRAVVIDWREAPISRLYYEYEAGEIYEEEIRGRERSGVVKTRRQVDATGGELKQIVEKGVFLHRGVDGAWLFEGNNGNTVFRKEEKSDHRLPEITALISPEQFRAITHPESSTVLLQGGAGSGKTTVGLHRIAYLSYQEPERFLPDRILVVMFNRSLQHYISRILPELGIGKGVQVETYHSWAGKLFRSVRLNISYSADAVPEQVLRIKKHPLILALVDRYLDVLLRKTRRWFPEQLDRGADPKSGSIRSNMEAAKRFEDLIKMLNTHPDLIQGPQEGLRKQLRDRLLNRFNDHLFDLNSILPDRTLLEETFGPEAAIPKQALNQLIDWQAKLRKLNRIDFADTGILLWLLQRKGLIGAQLGYAHVLVDEAQDLSEIELATLLHAADDRQSITICGDMAQKIKGDVAFNTSEGFAGFVRAQQQRTGAKGLCSDTLEIGFRATRPIMELAWHVLNEKPSMAVPREGEQVKILKTRNNEETIREAKSILGDYMEKRPKALIAVVCRYKADADRVFNELKALGLSNLRRHERDDFSFQPGVIVTNAHQVKGLEFSAVLVINPGAGHYRDDCENRMLLHVVITRASDHLWIVGHQPMAYELELWKSSVETDENDLPN